MRRFGASLAAGALALVVLPHAAAAQCEGGTTVAGHYAPDGITYVPGGCAETNPTTPGQLYPSGAQPAPSTNPAQGGSHLPGQTQPSDLIPVNSSDLGPAPSMVNDPAAGHQPSPAGVTVNPSPNVGTVTAPGVPSIPGTAVGPATYPGGPLGVGPAVEAPSATGPTTTLPGEIPPSGAPALTGNRGVPSVDVYPGSVVNPAAPAGAAPANAVAPPNQVVQSPNGTGSGPAETVRVRQPGSDDTGSAVDDGTSATDEAVQPGEQAANQGPPVIITVPGE